MDEDKNKSENKKGSALSESMLYKTFIKSAELLLAKPTSILTLAKKAVAHLFKYDGLRAMLSDGKEKIGIIIRLVEAYARNQYREVSTQHIILSIGALLYLVSPIDFIPDFFIGGLVDDIALLLWVYNNFKGEMEAFTRWEDRQKMRIELPEGDEKE